MRNNGDNNKVVCVTGGSGFVGTRLVQLLKKEKGLRVKILSRAAKSQADILCPTNAVKGDLLDYDSLIRFLEPHAIVINLAYLSGRSKEENIKAMENLSKACVVVGVERLIHCSTAVVVGSVINDRITEATICKPVSEYEVTKLEIENLLLRNLKGLCSVIIVRPTAIFGAGGRNLIKHAKELITEPYLKRIIKTSLYAKRRLNLVPVENVVAAIWYLARLDANIDGQCFIISDDEVPENNYQDVMALLSKHFGIRQTYVIPLPLQELILSILLRITQHTNSNPRRIYSCEKLISVGFKKPISFNSEIARFADWYKNLSKLQM